MSYQVKNLLLQLLFCLLIATCSAQIDNDIQIMEADQRYWGKMKEGGAEFYVLDVSNLVSSNSLLVIVRSFEPHSDPNIYISTQEKHPGADLKELACDSNGMDICSVPYELIKGKTSLYIAVRCREYCSYNLRSSYTSVENE